MPSGRCPWRRRPPALPPQGEIPARRRRHLRRERLLRASRPHPGPPHHGGGGGYDGHTEEALLPGDPEVGGTGFCRDASQSGRWSRRTISRTTRTSGRPTSSSRPTSTAPTSPRRSSPRLQAHGSQADNTFFLGGLGLDLFKQFFFRSRPFCGHRTSQGHSDARGPSCSPVCAEPGSRAGRLRPTGRRERRARSGVVPTSRCRRG